MDSERTGADDLDVSLDWPDQDPEDAGPDLAPPAEPIEADWVDQTPVTEPNDRPGSQLAVQVGPGPVADAAPLASLAIRIEALSAATNMMRVSVSDRLSDLHDQLARAQNTSARDVEDYRRLHDRALAEVRDRLSEMESLLGRIANEGDSVQRALDEQKLSLVEQLEDVWTPAAEKLTGQMQGQAERIDSLQNLLESVQEAVAAFTAAQAEWFAGLGETLRTQFEAIVPDKSDQEDLVRAIEEGFTVLARAHDDGLDGLHEAVKVVQGGQAAAQESQTLATAEVAYRLDQVVRRLDNLEAGASSPAGQQVMVERIEVLTAQVEALRRRIAVRARAEPLLDVAALDALAEAIAQRLAESAPPPTADPARRRRNPRT